MSNKPIFLKASEWLAKQPAERRLVDRINLNIKLNEALRKQLGEQLSPYVQVIKIEDNTLFVAAANQACAAKVRQMQMSLLEAARPYQQNVTDVRIKIVTSLLDQTSGGSGR